MPKVLVPIADGTEEIEAVTIIDVLRRAEIEVTVASVTGSTQVSCSRGVSLVADCFISECQFKTFDLIVLPGGMPGAEFLRHSKPLQELLEKQRSRDKWIGAICAAPAVALQPLGLTAHLQSTAYPGFLEKLEMPKEDRVVVDQKLVTSRGPGTAMEFAITLIELLIDKPTADEVAEGLLLKR